MNHDDATPAQHSATERQLRRLVVPEPADTLDTPERDSLY